MFCEILLSDKDIKYLSLLAIFAFGNNLMIKMLRKPLFIAILILVLTAFANPAADKTPQVRYVEKYSKLAVEEMYRSGVPASITLAQGLLESRYGLSELATKGNNHFGIKCHNDWQGGKVYHDDDRKGECFRKYDSPDQSFRDHSDFLRYRDRYKFLFDLEVNDYKGWAYGLKKAGYATDPAYPTKLIKLIEDYRLYMYDIAPSDYGNFEEDDVEDYAAAVKRDEDRRKKNADAMSRKEQRKEDKKAKKNQKARKNDRHAPETEMVMEIPESPTQAEAVKVIDKINGGEFHFNLSRQMFSQNGVPFVYSSPGETYASIAKSFDLFPKEILKFNDLNEKADLNKEIKPGTVVYVQAKKREASKGLDKHVIDEGDTLWGISQRYGVKLDRIYLMNGLDEWYVPKEGDIIRLR